MKIVIDLAKVAFICAIVLTIMTMFSGCGKDDDRRVINDTLLCRRDVCKGESITCYRSMSNFYQWECSVVVSKNIFK